MDNENDNFDLKVDVEGRAVRQVFKNVKNMIKKSLQAKVKTAMLAAGTHVRVGSIVLTYAIVGLAGEGVAETTAIRYLAL